MKTVRKALSILLVSSLILTAPGLEPYRAFAGIAASKPSAKPVVVQTPMIPTAGTLTNWNLIQLHLQSLGIANPAPTPKNIPAGQVNVSLLQDLQKMVGLSEKTAARLKDSTDVQAKKESDQIFGISPREFQWQMEAVVASLKSNSTLRPAPPLTQQLFRDVKDVWKDMTATRLKTKREIARDMRKKVREMRKHHLVQTWDYPPYGRMERTRDLSPKLDPVLDKIENLIKSKEKNSKGRKEFMEKFFPALDGYSDKLFKSVREAEKTSKEPLPFYKPLMIQMLKFFTLMGAGIAFPEPSLQAAALILTGAVTLKFADSRGWISKKSRKTVQKQARTLAEIGSVLAASSLLFSKVPAAAALAMAPLGMPDGSGPKKDSPSEKKFKETLQAVLSAVGDAAAEREKKDAAPQDIAEDFKVSVEEFIQKVSHEIEPIEHREAVISIIKELARGFSNLAKTHARDFKAFEKASQNLFVDAQAIFEKNLSIADTVKAVKERVDQTEPEGKDSGRRGAIDPQLLTLGGIAVFLAASNIGLPILLVKQLGFSLPAALAAAAVSDFIGAAVSYNADSIYSAIQGSPSSGEGLRFLGVVLGRILIGLGAAVLIAAAATHFLPIPGLSAALGISGASAILAMAPLGMPGDEGRADSARQRMLQDLGFLQNTLKAQYAPALWKKKFSGWELDEEIRKAREEVLSSPDMTIKRYQQIVRRLIQSTRDYHVSVRFFSTESASLPFRVQGANGRYFIVWIDREKLPKDSFPFEAGDELVRFDGKNAAEAVREIQGDLGKNSEKTEHALASIFLTARNASSGFKVPKGPVTISVKPKGSQKAVSLQLIWTHVPESVDYTINPLEAEAQGLQNQIPGSEKAVSEKPWTNDMLSPLALDPSLLGEENPFNLGTRKSFIPELGNKIWESGEDDPFHAYIYKSPADGKLIGYVRIPSYSSGGGEVGQFAKLMKKFQATTEALVIDQVNNPGGSVFYLYSLLSMLTDQPMATPKHRIAITQREVEEEASTLKLEPLVKNDEDARSVLGPTLGGYPVTYQLFRFMMDYARFILNEWKEGRTLTSPVYLYAVDSINPSNAAKYTKPVMILVNELDFSGGDFFPAILQDNKRATVFGTRTSGAGGFVRSLQYPNLFGIRGISLTGSIAERIDGNPIENLGISPDIEYALTEQDYQNGFADYVRAINSAMSQVIQKGGSGKSGENPKNPDSRRGFASPELVFVIAAASIGGAIGGLVSGIAAAVLTAAIFKAGRNGVAPKLSPSSVKILRHPDEILSYSLSPFGAKIATVSKDMNIRIWGRESGKLLHTLPYRWTKESAPKLLFSPDESKILAVHDSDDTADLWEIGPEKHLGQLKYEGLRFASFSRDGSQVVTAGSGAIQIFETGSLKLLSDFKTDSYFMEAFLSPDQTMLITTAPASLDEHRSKVQIYSLKDGKLLAEFPKAQGISLSADGRTAVVAENRAAFILDMNEQKVLHKLELETAPSSWFRRLFAKNSGPWIYSALMAPDGREAILSLGNGRALIFDAKEGKLLHVLKGSKGDLFSASLNYNGSAAVTAGQDGIVKFWNAESGRLMHKWKAHGGWASDSRFSPDGTKALTFAGDYLHDTTAILWDAEKGSPLLIARGYLDVQDTIPSAHKNQSWVSLPKWGGGKTNVIGSNIPHNYASFSPEGDALLVFGDRTLRVWDLAPERNSLQAVKSLADQTEPKKQDPGQSGFVRLELLIGAAFGLVAVAIIGNALIHVFSFSYTTASLIGGLLTMAYSAIQFAYHRDLGASNPTSKRMLYFSAAMFLTALGLIALTFLSPAAASASAILAMAPFGMPGGSKDSGQNPPRMEERTAITHALEAVFNQDPAKAGIPLKTKEISQFYQKAAESFKQSDIRNVKPIWLRSAVEAVLDAMVQSVSALAESDEHEKLEYFSAAIVLTFQSMARAVFDGSSIKDIVEKTQSIAQEIKKTGLPPLNASREDEARLLTNLVINLYILWQNEIQSYEKEPTVPQMAESLKRALEQFNSEVIPQIYPRQMRETAASIAADEARGISNLAAANPNSDEFMRKAEAYTNKIQEILNQDSSLTEKVSAVKSLADQTEPKKQDPGQSGFVRLEALLAFSAAALAPLLVGGLGYAISLAAGMNLAKALIVSGAVSLLPGLAAFLATHHMDMKMMGVEFIPKEDAKIGAVFSKALLASGVLSILGSLTYLMGLGWKAATTASTVGASAVLAMAPMGMPGSSGGDEKRQRTYQLLGFALVGLVMATGTVQQQFTRRDEAGNYLPEDALKALQEGLKAYKASTFVIQEKELQITLEEKKAVFSFVDNIVRGITNLTRAYGQNKDFYLKHYAPFFGDIEEIIRKSPSLEEAIAVVKKLADNTEPKSAAHAVSQAQPAAAPKSMPERSFEEAMKDSLKEVLKGVAPAPPPMIYTPEQAAQALEESAEKFISEQTPKIEAGFRDGVVSIIRDFVRGAKNLAVKSGKKPDFEAFRESYKNFKMGVKAILDRGLPMERTVELIRKLADGTEGRPPDSKHERFHELLKKALSSVWKGIPKPGPGTFYSPGAFAQEYRDSVDRFIARAACRVRPLKIRKAVETVLLHCSFGLADLAEAFSDNVIGGADFLNLGGKFLKDIKSIANNKKLSIDETLQAVQAVRKSLK